MKEEFNSIYLAKLQKEYNETFCKTCVKLPPKGYKNRKVKFITK